MKCTLSAAPVASELLAELRPPVAFQMTRPEFEELVRAPIEATIQTCTTRLDRLRMKWSDLASVIPVGGSSVIPLVRSRLTEAWGRPPVDVYESQLATVNGGLLRARAVAGVATRDTAAPTIVDFARTAVASDGAAVAT